MLDHDMFTILGRLSKAYLSLSAKHVPKLLQCKRLSDFGMYGFTPYMYAYMHIHTYIIHVSAYGGLTRTCIQLIFYLLLC